MRFPQTEHMKNENGKRKIEIKRTSILRMRKRQLKFIEHIMRKEGLVNLTHRGHTEDMRDRVKQQVTYLKSLWKWM